ALRREHDDASALLDAASAEMSGHEQAVAGLTERAERAQQTWLRVAAVAERVSATVRIATERAQHLDSEPSPTSAVDPDMLDAEADEVAATETKLVEDLDEARARREIPRAAMTAPERAAAEAERAHLAAVRAEADRREGLARLAGQVDTMRTRVESIDETLGRLTDTIEEAGTRAQHSQAEFETVQGRVGELDAGEVGLDEHHDRTGAALRLADERRADLDGG